jgi:hypothetical protein
MHDLFLSTIRTQAHLQHVITETDIDYYPTAQNDADEEVLRNKIHQLASITVNDDKKFSKLIAKIATGKAKALEDEDDGIRYRALCNLLYMYRNSQLHLALKVYEALARPIFMFQDDEWTHALLIITVYMLYNADAPFELFANVVGRSLLSIDIPSFTNLICRFNKKHNIHNIPVIDYINSKWPMLALAVAAHLIDDHSCDLLIEIAMIMIDEEPSYYPLMHSILDFIYKRNIHKVIDFLETEMSFYHDVYLQFLPMILQNKIINNQVDIALEKVAGAVKSSLKLKADPVYTALYVYASDANENKNLIKHMISQKDIFDYIITQSHPACYSLKVTHEMIGLYFQRKEDFTPKLWMHMMLKIIFHHRSADLHQKELLDVMFEKIISAGVPDQTVYMPLLKALRNNDAWLRIAINDFITRQYTFTDTNDEYAEIMYNLYTRDPNANVNLWMLILRLSSSQQRIIDLLNRGVPEVRVDLDDFTNVLEPVLRSLANAKTNICQALKVFALTCPTMAHKLIPYVQKIHEHHCRHLIDVTNDMLCFEIEHPSKELKELIYAISDTLFIWLP